MSVSLSSLKIIYLRSLKFLLTTFLHSLQNSSALIWTHRSVSLVSLSPSLSSLLLFSLRFITFIKLARWQSKFQKILLIWIWFKDLNFARNQDYVILRLLNGWRIGKTFELKKHIPKIFITAKNKVWRRYFNMIVKTISTKILINLLDVGDRSEFKESSWYFIVKQVLSGPRG